jgi:hypothetical protein
VVWQGSVGDRRPYADHVRYQRRGSVAGAFLEFSLNSLQDTAFRFAYDIAQRFKGRIGVGPRRQCQARPEQSNPCGWVIVLRDSFFNSTPAARIMVCLDLDFPVAFPADFLAA